MPERTRATWDDYFMQMARLAATRATCPRRSVGAVIVRDRFVIATGYNGSIPGAEHCLDVGCMELTPGGGCQRTIHAEVNAITQAARHGVSTLGSRIYVTTSPCLHCFKPIAAAGIKEIVYADEYREDLFHSMAKVAGISVRKL